MRDDEIEHLGVHALITPSSGKDNAIVVFIDTDFEPDASDKGPGLRVLLNDSEVYIGVPYLPVSEDHDDT